MSIKTYSGRPGSGKSYNSIANIIIPAIKQGRTVVTNVVLNKPSIYRDFPNANILTFPFSLNHEQAAEFINLERYPAGSVFVIDEGGKIFPSGLKVTNLAPSFLTFFTEHRHSVGPGGFAAEIFILCQDNSQLCKFIRDLIDTTYHHVKLDKHGMEKTFRVDIYDGSVNGQSTRATPTDSKIGHYKKEIFQYYESHTQKSLTADTALEVSPDKRGTLTHIYIKAGLAVPVVAVLAYFGYATLMSIFGSSSTEKTDISQEKTAPIQTVTVRSKPQIKTYSRQRSDEPVLS
ncbi:zonular occludens toxin domain-containing protein, partial [Thalassolituus sp.]|uniref:zonular occludens toxin domain-containing protein n=1 Tax=Thalassolituus sp. TaxID=2030822 RepID=UPI002A812683